jgi:hypothetical protein
MAADFCGGGFGGGQDGENLAKRGVVVVSDNAERSWQSAPDLFIAYSIWKIGGDSSRCGTRLRFIGIDLTKPHRLRREPHPIARPHSEWHIIRPRSRLCLGLCNLPGGRTTRRCLSDDDRLVELPKVGISTGTDVPRWPAFTRSGGEVIRFLDGAQAMPEPHRDGTSSG